MKYDHTVTKTGALCLLQTGGPMSHDLSMMFGSFCSPHMIFRQILPRTVDVHI